VYFINAIDFSVISTCRTTAWKQEVEQHRSSCRGAIAEKS